MRMPYMRICIRLKNTRPTNHPDEKELPSSYTVNAAEMPEMLFRCCAAAAAKQRADPLRNSVRTRRGYTFDMSASSAVAHRNGGPKSLCAIGGRGGVVEKHA
jgi:hypothetical protein